MGCLVAYCSVRSLAFSLAAQTLLSGQPCGPFLLFLAQLSLVGCLATFYQALRSVQPLVTLGSEGIRLAPVQMEAPEATTLVAVVMGVTVGVVMLSPHPNPAVEGLAESNAFYSLW